MLRYCSQIPDQARRNTIVHEIKHAYYVNFLLLSGSVHFTCVPMHILVTLWCISALVREEEEVDFLLILINLVIISVTKHFLAC